MSRAASRGIDLRGWRRGHWSGLQLLTLPVLAVAAVWVCRVAWLDIIAIGWGDEESSHVFLVPIVMGWLAWIRWPRLRRCRPSGEWIGLVLVLVGWAFSHVGYGHAIQAMWHAGAVTVLLGAVLTVLGRDVLRDFLPVFISAYFVVPVPGLLRQAVAGPLQRASAYLTEHLLEVLGAQVYRSGNLLTVNGVDVAVAEACNGMRMVMALVLVCFAFAFASPLRMPYRVLLVVLSPVVAVLCNIVRMVPTASLYGYSSESVASAFHDAAGWAMLVLALGVLFGSLRALRWSLVPVTRYPVAYQVHQR